MNVLTHRMVLDMRTLTSQANVHIKKGDTKNKLVISLSENGKMYELTEKAHAAFVGKKPDGKIVFNNCEVVGNTIEYTITAQTSVLAGMVDSEVRLYDANDNLLTSPRFTIVVDDTIYNADDIQIESENEINVLDSLIAEATALIKEIEDLIEEGIGGGGGGGGSGTVTDEQVATAVESYLEKNPVVGEPGVDGKDGYSVFEFFGDLCVLDGNKFSGDLFSVSNHGREVRAGDWLIYGTKFMKITSTEGGSVDATVICDLEGERGDDGKDGTSVTVTNVSTSTADGGNNVVTFSDGNTLTVKNGSRGSAGANGSNGSDGVGIKSVVQTTTSTVDGGSNVITVTKTDNTTSTFTVKNGSKGSAGEKGADGKTPARGTDYWTPTDKQEIKNDILSSIITQEAGESESLVMSQKAVTDLVAEAIGSGGGGGSSVEYETVDSVEEMTDTSKQYVLKETGTIWTYGEVTVEKEPENVFVPANVTLNKRLSSSGESNQNGGYITDYFAFDASTATSFIVWLPLDFNPDKTARGNFDYRMEYSDGSKTKLFLKYVQTMSNPIDSVYIGQDNNGRYYCDISITQSEKLLSEESASSAIGSTKYIRFGLGTSKGATAITVNDLANVDIRFEKDRGTTTINEWYNTGLTPSAGGGGGGNYVELLVKVNKNTTDINEVSNRVTALETGSETLTIPTFWQSAVDACIAKIKALQVGRNCVTFPFFSDNHQNNKYAGVLIAHIMKECHIPYCFFGGDSISNGIIADEATMIAQDKAFDTMMSYVPNGRFCRAVGNHDGFWNDGTNKYYYDRNQVYELFLREESIAQNKHFGEDGTYYYVDDIASKVRFIVMNTNNAPVDSTQIAWVQNTALSFNESGWAVVFISHQPISNHYHAGITNAADVVSAVVSTANTKNIPIIGWYSGHVHRDIIATKLLKGGNGSNAGTEVSDLGFTQVIITSDHTGIAYDDATKHTIANDDQSHAIDFVTINKATRTVNITRLGIGSDRSYTY